MRGFISGSATGTGSGSRTTTASGEAMGAADVKRDTEERDVIRWLPNEFEIGSLTASQGEDGNSSGVHLESEGRRAYCLLHKGQGVGGGEQ